MTKICHVKASKPWFFSGAFAPGSTISTTDFLWNWCGFGHNSAFKSAKRVLRATYYNVRLPKLVSESILDTLGYQGHTLWGFKPEGSNSIVVNVHRKMDSASYPQHLELKLKPLIDADYSLNSHAIRQDGEPAHTRASIQNYQCQKGDHSRKKMTWSSSLPHISLLSIFIWPKVAGVDCRDPGLDLTTFKRHFGASWQKPGADYNWPACHMIRWRVKTMYGKECGNTEN